MPEKVQPSVLIVDDDENFCRILAKLISAEAYQAVWTTDSSKVVELLATVNPSCVFLDLKLADLDGMIVLKRIKKFEKHLPVIILTGYESIETAVEAIQQGAFYYMPKVNLGRKELKKVLAKATKYHQMHQKLPILRKDLNQIENLDDFVKFSEKLQEMVHLDLLGSAEEGAALEKSSEAKPSFHLPLDLSLKEVVRRTIEHIEKKWILNSLIRSQWQQGKAAKLLGIDTKTLYNKMKTYHIQRE